MSEILKKVYVDQDGNTITTNINLHKKVDEYSYNQEKAEKTWSIKHDLNTTGINVQIFDENDEMVMPNKTIIENSFEVTIEFSEKQLGKALIIGNILP